MNQAEKQRTVVYYGVLIALLCAFIWGFIEIVAALKAHQVEAFDLAVIHEVQSWINEGRTQKMIFITNLGSVRWMTAGTILITLILLLKKRFSYALFFVLTVALGGWFNGLLKDLFKRQRPDILRLIEQGGYSFPSGHSMGSFIFYGAIAFLLFELLRHRWAKVTGTVAAVCLVFLIGLTRIYLGVHYPSDVTGGFTAGAAWLIFCIAVFHYYQDHLQRRNE
ncbi:phosphatase PAP2 family protein [Bacillus sp. REN10]|uniref:phosphatase PAP2 family protein n=1 Tax=Bacillus sp. REN10 TaxID=2782541 RepID=UPI001EED286B|nr:phosphatase PAP2 family protein [Bacillus sp. REN10]